MFFQEISCLFVLVTINHHIRDTSLSTQVAFSLKFLGYNCQYRIILLIFYATYISLI